MYSKIAKMPGVWTIEEEFDGEKVLIQKEVTLYRCIDCGRIHITEEKAEACKHKKTKE